MAEEVCMHYAFAGSRPPDVNVVKAMDGHTVHEVSPTDKLFSRIAATEQYIFFVGCMQHKTE